MKGNFVIGCVFGGLLAGIPALAADSLLQEPKVGPCAAAMEGPDYIPGVDADGQPVVRADLGADHTSVPDQVFIPLSSPGPNRGGRGGPTGRGVTTSGPYVAIDGRRLDPLINPTSCAAPDPVSTPAPKRR